MTEIINMKKTTKSSFTTAQYFRYMKRMDDKFLNSFNRDSPEYLFDEQAMKNKFNEYVKEKFSIFAQPKEMKNIEQFQGFEEMKQRKAKLKSGYYVTDVYSQFCLYQGPMDLENYWQTLKILAEDMNQMKFFTQIDNSTKGNTFSCHDLNYDFNVTLKNCKDQDKLQNLILYRLIFRTP